ncbi:MAG: hypothetical protein RXQ98_08770 [Sulfolobaceae archaeon]
MLNEDKEPKMLSKEVEKIKKDFGFMFDDDGTIEEYANTVMNGLQKLIDGLKENEEEFYKEALNSDNPNFIITTYYSLYLRFVTKVYLKLNKIDIKTTNDSRIKDIFNIAIFLVGFFGMPILLYIKKKEVFLHASELSVVLLHALIADRTLVPSKDSLGYYLFSKIHTLKEKAKEDWLYFFLTAQPASPLSLRDFLPIFISRTYKIYRGDKNGGQYCY